MSRPVISDITAVCIDASEGRPPQRRSGRMAALLLRVQADARPVRARSSSRSSSSNAGTCASHSIIVDARAEALDRLGVELPDLGTHGAVVRVDQQRALLGVTRQVNLPDPLGRHRRDVRARDRSRGCGRSRTRC